MKFSIYKSATGYDMSLGDTLVEILAHDIPLKDYPNHNHVITSYGLDAADAAVIIQGSIDNISWFNIASVVLPVSVPVAILDFPNTSQIVATGFVASTLINGSVLYIDGSTTNDGRKTISGKAEGRQISYAAASGPFIVGETIIADDGDTGVILSDNGVDKMVVDPSIGDFSGSATITGSASASTANVTAVVNATLITVEEPITVEAAVGNIWKSQTRNLPLVAEDVTYLYFRFAVDVNSVTAGLIDLDSIAKSY